MAELAFRDFTERDIDACVQLLREGHDPRFSRGRFAWLHLQNPLAPSRIALAWDNNRLIGFYAVIKKKLLINGQTCIGGRDIDPVVHPDFRGKGVFGRLLQYGLVNFTEIDVLFNFANTLSAPGFLKQGWQSLGMLQDYIFQTDHNGWGVKPVFASALSWSHLALVERSQDRRTVEEVWPGSLRDYDGLFDCLLDSGIQVERGAEYLDWRYLKKPGCNYRFFAEKNQGSIERLYILKFNEDIPEIILCDVVQTFDAGSSFAALFCELRGLGRGYKIKIWGSFHRALQRQFVKKPFSAQFGQNVLVRQVPGKNNQPELYHIQNWMITHGDLEVI